MGYGLLGVVEVRPAAGGPPLDLGSPLQRVLLGLLLTEPGRTVPVHVIVDELWGATPPADPEASLHTYVSRLRRVLGPARLLRSPAGYRLDVDPADVDASRFEQLVPVPGRLLADGDASAALRAAESALALWRGPRALEDAGDRPFAVAARARLDTLRLACQEDRLGALLALGRGAEVLAEAEAMTVREPLRERPWALLVEALHVAGRRAEALERYQHVHRLLDDELGLSPGPALRLAQARALGTESVAAPARPMPHIPARAPTGAGLVGRDAELALLLGVVDGLGDTGPRFVLVDGEPGIGKTRLATELTARVAATGGRVAWGRCHEDDDAPAFWPWRQVVGALDPDRGPLLRPGDDTFTVFESVLRTLVAASAGGPVLVVLDDLQWADPASLRLLSFLAVELQHGPIALLATCRTGEHPAHLAQVRATLARTASPVVLAVAPLGPDHTAELVRRVARTVSPARDAGLADVVARSGGNPFFATELARFAGDPGAVPPGVRDVVDRRLATLPDGVRPVLRLAAVVGQRFPVPLVERAVDRDPAAVADALDAALAADLLRAEGPGLLAFSHALVRDGLLEELPHVGRARLHARVAAALPPSSGAFERAHHLVAGQPFTDAAAAVTGCTAAAEEAAGQRAYETAARWWERAAGVTSERAERARLLARAGSMMTPAGLLDDAHRVLAESIDLALAVDDTGTAASAAASLTQSGGLWHWAPYGTYPGELIARFESVLAALPEVAVHDRVLVLGALSTGCAYGPDRARGPRVAAEALDAAREAQDGDLLTTAIAAALSALWMPGMEAGQEALATELLALAVRPDQSALAVLALARRSGARLALGNSAGADEDLAGAWQLAEEHRLPLLQAQLVSIQAGRALLAGELDLATELTDRAQVLTQRTQLYRQQATDLLMRCFVWIDQGRLAEHLPLAPQDLVDPDAGQVLLTAISLLQAGRPDDAASVMRTHHGFAQHPDQWDAVSLTCWQAYVVGELSAAGALAAVDPTVPARIAERLRPHADLIAVHGGIGGLGPVALFLGTAEAAAGRAAESEVHLRRAVDVAARHRLRPALARARLTLAELLAARGAGAEAAEQAVAARDVAEAVGMRLVVERAARLVV